MITAFLALDGAKRRRFLRAAAAIGIANDVWAVSMSSHVLACVQAIETLIDRPPQDPCATCKRDKGPGPTQLFRECVEKYRGTCEIDEKVLRDLYGVRSAVAHGRYLFQLDEAPWSFSVASCVASSREDETFRPALVLAKEVLRNWLLSQTAMEHPKPKLSPSSRKAFLTKNKTESLILMSVVLVAVAFAGLLVNISGYRPHLIALVAALGAIFAAMPNVLSDSALVRWVTAAIGGLCVVLGTWFTAVELDHQKEVVQLELNSQRQQNKEQIRKTETLHSAFLASTREVPAEQQVAPIINIANLLHAKFTHGKYADVLDLGYLLLEVYPDNGHALYYSGEAWRVSGRDTKSIRLDLENMRGVFKQYIAKADTIPESRDGARDACYHRASGFCGERTAWILHMMANDTYREGLKLTDPRRKSDELERASGYASQALALWSKGFEKTSSFEATVMVKEAIAKELEAMTGGTDSSQQPTQQQAK